VLGKLEFKKGSNKLRYFRRKFQRILANFVFNVELICYLKLDIRLMKFSNMKNRLDIILLHIFNSKYFLNIVEAGASDGINDSPSYALEKFFSANVLLIEPIRSSYAECKANRSGRVVNTALSDINFGYVIFQEMGIKSLSRVQSAKRDRLEHRRTVRKEYRVRTSTLNHLAQTKIPDRDIDILILDVEGSELSILRSIDFDHLQINVICVEHNYRSDRKDIYKFLTGKQIGYRQIAKNISFNNDIFVNKNFEMKMLISK
jgi:FkbM family methyltransferase